MPVHILRKRGLLIALTGTAFLGGCATFSPDGGLEKVAAITQERSAVSPSRILTEEDSVRVADEVKRLLSEPLTAETSVKIAILNNRGLQASLANLGIAEAELVQASRLRNPGFTFSRLSGGGVSEIERQFLFDVLGLLTLPTRTEIERRRFEIVQTKVASEVLRLAQQTRQAFFSAVAAQQAARYMETVREAAGAGAELAGRMAEVGNFSRLRASREQLLSAELGAEFTRARQNTTQQRERLTRLMGLSGKERDFKLPERLPELPAALIPEQDIQRQAMGSRLDIRTAKLELEGLAKSLGLTRATRFVNVLEVSYLNADADGEPDKRGYEIELALPIFDWGEARSVKAESLYSQAMHRVAEIAVNAESEVNESYAAYRAAHELAGSYRDKIVPLARQISEENLLRYNGMLIGVWELLADTRAQVASVNASIQALKDFWLAESNLQISLNSGGAASQALTIGAAPAADAGGGH